MKRTLFGLETEYGLAAFGPHKDRRKPRDSARVGSALIGEVSHRRSTLPDSNGSGVFLANGSRVYLDVGGHPEFSTVECTRPEELMRYALAGDEIMTTAAEGLERISRGGELYLFKTNVDYTFRQTWGSHESYLCGCDHRELAESMIPHLVTRVVYTGAGGFRASSAGLEFVISPRAFFLVRPVSQASRGARPIFDLRDEPHADGGGRRMHLICGESLCGELGQYLRIGATALVVCMAEAKLPELEDFALNLPVTAMHDVSRDPTLRTKVRMRNGSSLTALQVQRLYLGLAERHLGSDFMPEWAAEVCRRWRDMLNILENDPESVATVLDWAIKLSLFRAHCRERELDWGNLPAFSEAACLLDAEEIVLPESVCDAQSVTSWLAGPLPRYETMTKKTLDGRGLCWEQFLHFLAVREELFEIDRSFATLGSRSLFKKLDAAGLLAHSLDIGVSTSWATTHPSSCPRAAVRGNTVLKFSGLRRDCRVDWSCVLDYTNRRWLGLGDPFARQENWTPFHAPTGSDPMGDDAEQLARNRT